MRVCDSKLGSARGREVARVATREGGVASSQRGVRELWSFRNADACMRVESVVRILHYWVPVYYMTLCPAGLVRYPHGARGGPRRARWRATWFPSMSVERHGSCGALFRRSFRRGRGFPHTHTQKRKPRRAECELPLSRNTQVSSRVRRGPARGAVEAGPRGPARPRCRCGR
jgi:hypothetical protein